MDALSGQYARSGGAAACIPARMSCSERAPFWNCPTEQKGEAVTLRALGRSDRTALLKVFRGFEDAFTTFVPDCTSIDAWFDKVESKKEAGRSFPYSVLDSSVVICGTTSFMRMSPVQRRLEIGRTIYAPRVRRTRLNTEAKSMLFHHAFEALACNVVQLQSDWLNRQSRRAIERLGAKLDGILRSHMIMAGGHMRDTACYSVIASQWPRVRAHLQALRNRPQSWQGANVAQVYSS